MVSWLVLEVKGELSSLDVLGRDMIDVESSVSPVVAWGETVAFPWTLPQRSAG